MTQRKKLILKFINDLVQMFNENNKQVRESNKNSKSEQEISELIKTNE